MSELGELQPVDISKVWTREDEDFTPWLFEQENLNRLADVLNMKLKPVGREVEVGQYYADILCRNTADNSLVVIENQLRGTDHKHLGQALTYAAGLEATTIVWISAVFTDEHCNVLDLLNAITDEHYKFFGVEIELWQIGDSLPAPIFKLVSKPKDLNYTRSQDEQHAKRNDTSKNEFKKKKFLIGLSEYIVGRNSLVQSWKSTPVSFLNFIIGRSVFEMRMYPRFQNKSIAVRLYIFGPNAATYFHLLADQRQEIEREFDESLEWDELQGKNYSRISWSKSNRNLLDETDWQNQYEWIVTKLERFKEILSPHINKLNPVDWRPNFEEDE